jgi:hypothetical protein
VLHTLQASMILPLPLVQAFPFFANVADLKRITNPARRAACNSAYKKRLAHKGPILATHDVLEAGGTMPGCS